VRRKHTRAADFLVSQSPLPHQRLASAQTIYLAGFTLGRTTREYLRFLDERLQAGVAVRIMILEPRQELLEMCALRSSGVTSAEHWRKRLDSTASIRPQPPQVRTTNVERRFLSLVAGCLTQRLECATLPLKRHDNPTGRHP
jgi:hypothetical protein